MIDRIIKEKHIKDYTVKYGHLANTFEMYAILVFYKDELQYSYCVELSKSKGIKKIQNQTIRRIYHNILENIRKTGEFYYDKLF